MNFRQQPFENKRKTMDEIKISVIMPVYKVEKYVAKAIESILAQTLKEFEFIIVDDGTPDNSGAICDEYAKKDSRIKVIHKENGGAPSARNTAMDIARGKYFFFLDSDDWAEENMLERMYELAEKDQAQLLVCGFYIDTYYGKNKDKYISENVFVDNAVYTSARDFRENSYRYYDRNLLYTPWNKLYLAKYLNDNNLRFPNVFWDDFPFNITVVRNVERVVVSTESFYHFLRAREESESSKFNPTLYEKREEEHQWLIDLYKEWQVDSPEVKEMLSRRYVERVVECVTNVTSSNSTLQHKQRIEQIKKIINNPRVKECLAIAKPRSSYMKLMLLPIRWRATGLVWLESTVITTVKEKNTELFAKLKAGR